MYLGCKIWSHRIQCVNNILSVLTMLKSYWTHTVFWHVSLLKKVWSLILLKSACSWPIRVVVCNIINICSRLIYIFPIHAMCFHYFSSNASTTTLYTTFVTTCHVASCEWWRCGPTWTHHFSSSLIASHVTSCGKCCVKCCGTSTAPFFLFFFIYWNQLWTLYDYPSVTF